jgi:hypothetical protein
MKRTMMVAVLGLLGIGLSACGSSTSDLTPQAACNEAASATCQRVSTCAGAVGLAALGATSLADCTTQMEAQNCTAADVACTSPQKFSPANAQACVNAITALTCADLASSATADPTPAVCNQVCQ